MSLANVVGSWIGSLVGLLAQTEDPADTQLLLGEDFLPWMVLAIGAALVVGPVVALFRPPADRPDDAGPPLARTLVMVGIGAVCAIWGLASLLS